jgi:drug/metabolite transporter (DMT)-like permease
MRHERGWEQNLTGNKTEREHSREDRSPRNTPETEGSVLPRRGYLYAALAALLWAVSGSSAKFLFQEGITPFHLVQMRVTLGGGILLVWMLIRSRSLLRISMKDILYFAALGSLGLAMAQFTYFLAISKIQVASAILLQYLAPIFIVLHALMFAREKLTRLTLLSVAAAMAGCYLVVGGYNLDLLSMNREGIIAGVASAVTFAWYSVYGERGMQRYHPWTVLFYAFFFAALFWNVIHFLWSPAPAPFESFRQSYSLTQWAVMIYISTLGTIIPFGLYLEAINLIRSTRASITATLEPITAGVVSFIFLGEALEPLQILGALLVIGAIIALQLRREHDDGTPALIRNRARVTGPG